MKISLDTNSFVHSDDTELNQRCDALEDEVTKLKKVLQYERSIKDSMRNSLEETKRNSSAEIKRLSDEATLAINRSRNMEETITLLRSLQIEYEAKVNYYKDDLEKTEQQLQDALL
jgi:predicted  nucleic acid-binding Zn-ribbon protein